MDNARFRGALCVFAVLCLSLGSIGVCGAVELVENHQSRWRIVSPSVEKPGIPWAIRELRKYVEQMSGVKLADGGLKDAPAIVVGLRGDFSPEDQAALPPPAKGYDGYAVTVREGSSPRILIAGDNGRGAIYGVYDVLERLGCRWFYPSQDPRDSEVVPHVNSLQLGPASWAVASPMKFRIFNGDAWDFHIDYANAAKQVDHAMKLRANLIGWQCATDQPLLEQYEGFRSHGLLAEMEKREMGLHGPMHCFPFFMPNEHFAKHPEWFGMLGGKRVRQNFFGAQFCWSNAEARKVFVENVAALAKAAPQIRVLQILPFDGGKACDCPECRRLGASNGLLNLMQEVIERLQVVRPELLVETAGGYPPMVEPPTTAKIHPKQRIAWAHWGRYMAFGYDDPRYERKSNLQAWRKAAPGGVMVSQYYSDNFAEPWVMSPFAIAIQGDRKYLLEQQIDSVYLLIYPPGYWWNHGLNTYLSSLCYYDASLDPFALIQDYAKHYYGPKAGPLFARYFDQWARDPDLCYRLRGDATRQDRETLARQRKELLIPAIQATQGDPVYAHRVDKAASLHAFAERLAEVHRFRHQVQLARSQGDFDKAAKKLEAARNYIDATLAWCNALADRNEGLVDKNEVSGMIKRGVTGWLDVEAKAVAAKDSRVNKAELRKERDESEAALPGT